jgi:hypothetical protein
LHYVKLANAPLVWRGLAEADLTARGACGNTVRNITASPTAGIDPDEPFDVTPYVQATFEYFLRNAICQDMGRKVKMAFSSSEKDSGFTYFHDFGFIATQREIDGKLVNGFRIVVGGGLGAQSLVAQTLKEFVPATDIIPIVDAAIRVFDRMGERQKRHKARMKFLVKDLGVDLFLQKIEEELKAVPPFKITVPEETMPQLPKVALPEVEVDEAAFNLWKTSNVFEQKQKGYYGAFLSIHLGDVAPDTARGLARLDRLGNVQPVHGELAANGVVAQADAAITALNLHDLYNGQNGEATAVAFAKGVYDALKPGGVFGVIDHVGIAGQDNAGFHRLQVAQARDVLTKAGFTIEAESNILANPADDHTKGVRDMARHTDQFLIRARKLQ